MFNIVAPDSGDSGKSGIFCLVTYTYTFKPDLEQGNTGSSGRN